MNNQKVNIGNVFILGDSYSTFENHIPEGFAAYYTRIPCSDTDVDKVEQTWWHRLLSDTRSNLLLNSSFSGTTICHTGYNAADCSEKSFIARLDKLIAEGYFEKNKVDTFFLFGGTNDSWADSPIGEMKYADWTKEELYSVLPAIGYLLHRLTEKLAGTRVICIINTELKEVITDSLLAACKKYGVETVVLHDIDKISGHPTILGMQQIEEQVLAHLKAEICPEELKPLRSYLDSLWEKEYIPGCDCIVYRGYERIFRHRAGFRNAEKTVPVSVNDRYILYSASKVLTCTAALQLIERGYMKLEDPVAKYLPEFADMYVGEWANAAGEDPDRSCWEKAKNQITVEHLMTMRGGFDYNLTMHPILKAVKEDPNASTGKIVSAMAEYPLHFEPGTRFMYSFCHDILAAVIEVVSGQRFSDYMKANIFDPLGMTSSGYSVEAAGDSISQQYTADPVTRKTTPTTNTSYFEFTPEYESGGAGMVASAEDYGKFVAAMCNYGVGANGARILSKESIDLMRKDFLDEACKADYAGINRPGYSYGLGVRTLVEKEKSGVSTPLGEFGWDGAAGAYVLIDVKNKIGVFYAQQVLGRDFSQAVHAGIRESLYEGLGLAE